MIRTSARRRRAITTAEDAENIFKNLAAQNASFADIKDNLKAAALLIQFAKKQGY